MEITFHPKFKTNEEVYLVQELSEEYITLDFYKENREAIEKKYIVDGFFVKEEKLESGHVNIKVEYYLKSLKDTTFLNASEDNILRTDHNILEELIKINKDYINSLWSKADEIQAINEVLKEESQKEHICVGNVEDEVAT